MRRAMLCVIIAAVFLTAARAQTDVLGAHNCFGRGCNACHVPAGGAAATSNPNQARWGQNLTPRYGQAAGPGSDSSVSIPASSMTGASHSNFVVIQCLSCHDGNIAKSGMIKGATVETLPASMGQAPSFLNMASPTAGSYGNDHPVGANARIVCGGAGHWDCSISAAGVVSMNGPVSSQFARNYGFPIAASTDTGNAPIVTCNSCHDPHSETVWYGKIGGVQANWKTTLFVRGPYTPGASTTGNAASQFCRSCHAAQSNEMHGLMNVATTGISRF